MSYLTVLDAKRSSEEMQKPASLVKIQKDNQGIVNCDVYIGPRIVNKYWRLAESIWSCPPHCFALISTNATLAFEMYARHILHNSFLRQKLLTLQGKTLGCFCSAPELCHGSVLVKLINSTLPKKDIVVTKTKGVFFKGSTTPLSNYFPCTLEDKYLRITFTSAIQMYAYRHLWYMGQQTMADKVLRTNNPYYAYNQLKCCLKINKEESFTFEQQVQEMAKILQLKWDTVPQFAAECHKYKAYDYIEGTTSSFWGGGKDISEITTDFDHINVPGKNILGWIMKWIHANNTNPKNWEKYLTILKHDPLLHNLNFFKGLLSVDRILSPKK